MKYVQIKKKTKKNKREICKRGPSSDWLFSQPPFPVQIGNSQQSHDSSARWLLFQHDQRNNYMEWNSPNTTIMCDPPGMRNRLRVCRKLPFALQTGSPRLQPGDCPCLPPQSSSSAQFHHGSSLPASGLPEWQGDVEVFCFFVYSGDEGDIFLKINYCLLSLSWNGNFIYRSNSSNRHRGP